MPGASHAENKQISHWAISIFGFYDKFWLRITTLRKLYQKYERIYNRPRTKMSNKIREVLVNLFTVDDAAGLDYIDKEIISHAEWEKSVRMCVKSHELLVQQELKVFGRLPVM